MGHKVHPTGFRIGVIRDWQAKWYADKHYAEFLQEDLKLRRAIQSRYSEAAVSLVEIERQSNQVTVAIHTARPGIVIGRGGQRVDEMRRYLEQLVGKRIQLNIQEIQQPELDSYLVAKAIAEQMERRVAYRRAMKQAMLRTMQAGARGVKISCAGRLGGAEIARRLSMHDGRVPLHTLRADIDYGFVEARTTMGRIGVKVWIYKGDILPQPAVVEEEEIGAELEAGPPTFAEAVEAPTEPVAEATTEAVPAAEAEEAPLAEAEEVGAEIAPLAEAEEAPAEPVAGVSAEAPASVEVEEVAVEKAEEAPPKRGARRKTKAASPAEVMEAPAEPTAEVSTEAESSTEPGEDSNVTT